MGSSYFTDITWGCSGLKNVGLRDFCHIFDFVAARGIRFSQTHVQFNLIALGPAYEAH